MKAETLKKAILQYAMQGKLVEQDPKDEPASVLLERIKTEKEQLIKDGKIKKEKPLPPISEDEIPYELPKGWEWCRLGELSIINGGYAFKSQEYINTGIRVVRISDFDEKGFKKDKIVYYKENEKYDDFILGNNDILLAMTGGTVGKSYYVENLQEKMYVNQRVADIKISIIVNSKYINYLILSPLTQDKITSCKNSTNDNISMQDIKEFYVPLPPLAEQERIVEKLEQILPLVEEYGKNEEKLSKLNSTLPDKIKQSILQHAVQGKLVPQSPDDEPASVLLTRIKAEKEQLIKDGKIKKEKPLPPITDDEIPFQIPNSWEWVKLGEIVNYGSTGSVEYSDSLDKNTWILDLEDIEKGTSKLLVKNRIQNKAFNSTKKCFQIGDVLYGKLRPYLDKVLVADEDGICTTEILPLRVYADLNPFYLRLVLKNPTFLQYVNQLTYGVKMPRLGTDDGRNALIPLPPLAEQQRIVTKVAELLSIVESLKV